MESSKYEQRDQNISYIYIYRQRQIDRLRDRQTDRQADRHIDRQTDRQTDRQGDRQTDRQRETLYLKLKDFQK